MITVAGIADTVLLFVVRMRYATPEFCPGQPKAESAVVRKIKMRGMKIPTEPIYLVMSFICINYLLEKRSTQIRTAARDGGSFPKRILHDFIKDVSVGRKLQTFRQQTLDFRHPGNTCKECSAYIRAFEEIEADPNNDLILAEVDGEVVGSLQLTCTPSISFRGGKSATVESVRVDTKFRGTGIGRKMMLWTIELAKRKGCISIQLTTNNDREDAQRVYQRLGFQASRVGMKLSLN